MAKTLCRNRNDIILSLQNTNNCEKNIIQILNDLKEWVTIYWGSKKQVQIKKLAPCTCYNFRIKPENSDKWTEFKAATSDGPFLIMHLTRAIQFAKIATIRKIIHASPNLLEIQNKEGKTPLIQSIEKGDLQITSILINLGADVNKSLSGTKRTPLMVAVYHGQLQIASLLVDKGSNINCVDINGLNILHYAVDSNRMQNVIFALNKGIFIDSVDWNGLTPLLRAATMRKSMDHINEKERIFHLLLDECKYSTPGAELSYNLRCRLEKLPIVIRREIVNREKVGCTPLFIACKKGQSEIVEYLLTVCQADIEQKGVFQVPDDRSTHTVTPLWCAAVAGKLNIVQILLKHNANINAISDTGSTPVRSACFMTHLEVVKCLVAHGADINKPNFNGGTCLINSVQSAPLCKFLLEHGALVNARDIQNKTALHYAIQEHRLETTKLLLKNGANYSAKSRYGDDALQMACLKGAPRIFDYLTLNICYSPEKLANAHELMGATFLDEHNEVAVALFHWKEALKIRQRNNLLPKRPIVELIEEYRFQKEFETEEEYEIMSTNLDLIRIQSLMITERILGPHHKDTIFRLMYRGAAYADMMRYQRCIDLWRLALKIRVQNDSILYTDTCFTAQALVRQMVDYHQRTVPNNEESAQQRFHDVISTFKLITSDINDIRHLLDIQPVYKRQAEFFDKILKCVTHLIYLMTELAKDGRQIQIMIKLISDLIKVNPRSVCRGDTLLHMCLSKSNMIRSSYFVDEEPIVIFPQFNIVKLLLDCGANVNTKNDTGWTPLHVATLSENCTSWLVKLLLEYGGHIDIPNNLGKCPSDSIMEINKYYDIDVHVLNHISLKCFCSAVINKFKIPYQNQIPKTLEYIVKLHEQ